MISSFINGLFVRQVDLVWGTTPPIFQGPTAWLLARLKGVPFCWRCATCGRPLLWQWAC
jgi:hypothetical protein